MTDYSWLKPMDDRIAQLREETARIRKTVSEECEEDYDSFDTIEELFEDLHAEDVQAPNGDFLKNYPEVTRVEVITDDGREFVRYDCSNVQMSLQDDGRTLKVFLKQEQISEEENEVRFKECLKAINNLKSGEITELMGEAFMEEFRRVSQ
jgi:hypothetical protein